jgi:hypothetical protein
LNTFPRALPSSAALFTAAPALLTLQRGEEMWQFPTNDTSYASPAVSNGVLYIASTGGYFYAIGEPLTTPSPNPSPKPENPFPTELIIAAVAVLAVFGLVLLVYFRKRRH